MSCTIDGRDQGHRAIHLLGKRDDVVAIDLIEPAVDPTCRWTVEIAVDAEFVPPAISSI